MAKPSAELLFNDIARFISVSQSLLKAGSMTQLAGLDDQVRVLCEAVLKLSKEDRALYADRLEQLLADLQQLGDDMAASRDKLAEEIRNVSQFKQANVAYRTTKAIKVTEADRDRDEDDVQ